MLKAVSSVDRARAFASKLAELADQFEQAWAEGRDLRQVTTNKLDHARGICDIATCVECAACENDP